jgi:hypothetical protein
VTWERYDRDSAEEEWGWPRPKAFDESWILRFRVAARKAGFALDGEDLDPLITGLIDILASYEGKQAESFPRIPDLEHFWLAASASIVLCEITGERLSRRVFPFGAAGFDPDLRAAPWRKWHAHREEMEQRADTQKRGMTHNLRDETTSRTAKRERKS